jgi:DNA-binding PadR family transcriptional regulator
LNRPHPDPTDLLPLPRATFHALLALQEEPLHGYGVKQKVERLSKGAIRMAPGTLYETLHRMRERGLVVEAAPPEKDRAGHAQRTLYRLTAFGRDVLRAEVELLGSMVDHARSLMHAAGHA